MIDFRALLSAALLAPVAASAETPLSQQLSIELNATQPADTGCKLSFLVVNGHDKEVAKAVYEAVLFDSQGQVNRLMLFDFGALPTKRPRVRQFVVPSASCAGLGQILINGVHQCDGTDLPENACTQDLKLNSRTDIEVIG
ncbi:MAG: hypothetical protein N4A61_03595 [Pelagimonas sp.]|jgi:hypothetical protein|nr:hypothetical protein [Pelagimonas sp.]